MIKITNEDVVTAMELAREVFATDTVDPRTTKYREALCNLAAEILEIELRELDLMIAWLPKEEKEKLQW